MITNPSKSQILTNQKEEKEYLSAIVAMVRKARMRERSGLELRLCQRPREDEGRESELVPEGREMTTVERPPSARRGLEGPPTRTGSLSADSLAKVLHSEVSSIE